MNRNSQAWLDGLPQELQISIERTCRINPNGFRNLFGVKDRNMLDWTACLWLPTFTDDNDYAGSTGVVVASGAGDSIDEAIADLRDRWQEVGANWQDGRGFYLDKIAAWVEREKK